MYHYNNIFLEYIYSSRVLFWNILLPPLPAVNELSTCHIHGSTATPTLFQPHTNMLVPCNWTTEALSPSEPEPRADPQPAPPRNPSKQSNTPSRLFRKKQFRFSGESLSFQVCRSLVSSSLIHS